MLIFDIMISDVDGDIRTGMLLCDIKKSCCTHELEKNILENY